MGVLERAIPGVRRANGEPPQYVCLACETPFEVQHHTCPACGSFDVRRSKWVR